MANVSDSFPKEFFYPAHSQDSSSDISIANLLLLSRQNRLMNGTNPNFHPSSPMGRVILINTPLEGTFGVNRGDHSAQMTFLISEALISDVVYECSAKMKIKFADIISSLSSKFSILLNE